MCINRESNPTFGKRLTFAKLKTHKGFEDITEEEAVIIIDGLQKLSLLTFSIFKINK